MSLGAPKINPPAPAAAPADQGADALKIGDDSALDRSSGGIGRLALRIPSTGSAAPTGTGM